MIVVNEDSVIHGNTVLQPKYNPSIDKGIDREKEAKRKIKERNQRQRRLKDKVKVIRNIALTFAIGLTLVGRYCYIYNMQMELNSIKSNIGETNKDNENLKVELVKYNNLQYIEETAINRLHMLPPDKSSAIYTDLHKDVIQYTEKKSKEETQQNIWNKLKKMLF
ncbi:hypothetical protein [Clostridium sp. DJ247]|uniref:hypothetical protein n=1 Tax=Clostridium sp. DJ247 TaxID=2726188 RepID=UPI0016271E93|nr:hypothetical protein [Clostridium sp. DJ247]MBC2580657.1 hypothetical protein [Clostridium sp. DJ247]MBC2580692.1 hypothetical protein [Clostridium sp. DJ247]